MLFHDACSQVHIVLSGCFPFRILLRCGWDGVCTRVDRSSRLVRHGRRAYVGSSASRSGADEGARAIEVSTLSWVVRRATTSIRRPSRVHTFLVRQVRHGIRAVSSVQHHGRERTQRRRLDRTGARRSRTCEGRHGPSADACGVGTRPECRSAVPTRCIGVCGRRRRGRSARATARTSCCTCSACPHRGGARDGLVQVGVRIRADTPGQIEV